MIASAARLVAPTIAACLWAWVFSSYGRPWVAFFALVPLFLSLRRGRFLTGWWFGIVFWCLSIPWIATTLNRFGGLPPVFAWLSLLLLAAYLALYFGAFSWIAHYLIDQKPVIAYTAVPAAWVLTEKLMGWAFTGFPWNPAAQGWTDLPGALPFAAWFGASGVSWLVILIQVALTRSLRNLHWSGLLAIVASVATLLAIADRWAVKDQNHSVVEVAVMQPASELLTSWDRELVERQYQETLELARTACPNAGLSVWPESAAFPFSYGLHQRLRDDVAALAQSGCTVILNGTREASEGAYNTAFVVGEDGAIGSYDKVHLVPWGEYVPLRRLLPFMNQVARNASEFNHGQRVDGVELQGGELGVSICYDAIYPAQTRRLVANGAELLVHLTNDAWYGDTSAPRQLLRAARFRAAESGRFVVRAALTGISAIVDPGGEVVSQLPLDQAGVVRGRVRWRDQVTFYHRTSWLVPIVATIALAFAIVNIRRARLQAVDASAVHSPHNDA